MASQSAASSPPRAPFDDEDADIIFQSSDNVDFRLYKVVVAKASRVMRDMLALPSDPSSDAVTPQVVHLTETARTLEHVFRLCYPVEHPHITTLEDIHAVLEAARKYEMAAVTANVLRPGVLRQFLPKEPLRVYAIAYVYEVEEVAREAAVLLLDDPSLYLPATPPLEFHVLPSVAIHAVHTYRQRCVEAALRVLDDHDWVLNGDHERARLATSNPDPRIAWCWVVNKYGSGYESSVHSWTCSKSSTQSQFQWYSQSGPVSYGTLQWWITHTKSIRSALASRPTGAIVRAHLADPSSSEVLRQAMSCSYCAPKVHADLTLFDTLLAARVDAAVAAVRIDLPFPGE